MYGLEAISNASGWSMAIAGALIGMAGLAALSFVISLFPKVISMLEKREGKHEEMPEPESEALEEIEPGEADAAVSSRAFPLGINELKTLYAPLAESLGESFQLTELYEASREKDHPHVHLSIRTLVDQGVLVPQGDGVFSWKD